MDKQELARLGNEIAGSLLTNKGFERVAYGIQRVVSYLESEQTKREELAQQIKEHATMLEEFKRSNWELSQLKEQSKRNGKMIMGVLASMVTYLAIELVKMAAAHK